MGVNYFFLEQNLFSEGKQNNFDRVATQEIEQFIQTIIVFFLSFFFISRKQNFTLHTNCFCISLSFVGNMSPNFWEIIIMCLSTQANKETNYM